jgi:hypothetical protein
MEVYRNLTCLHGSDRHVLTRYQSEFFEFSPESITGKKSPGSEKRLSKDINDTPGQYILKNR